MTMQEMINRKKQIRQDVEECLYKYNLNFYDAREVACRVPWTIQQVSAVLMQIRNEIGR